MTRFSTMILSRNVDLLTLDPALLDLVKAVNLHDSLFTLKLSASTDIIVLTDTKCIELRVMC